MMTDFNSQLAHEKYEELCALSTAGVLTAAESELLSHHLKTCARCEEAFAQYQQLVADGMPFLADPYAVRGNAHQFDEPSARARLMQAAEMATPQPPPVKIRNKSRFWNQPWITGLVAASLAVAVGAGSYWTGTYSTGKRLQYAGAESQDISNQAVAKEWSLNSTIQKDKQQIAILEQNAVADANEVEKLRAASQTSLNRVAEVADAMNVSNKTADAQVAALMQERDAAASKLREAEKMYQSVQDEVTSLRSQRQIDLVHLASLETRADNLTAALNDESKQSKTDEQYLASDKDIRDLIGARNLYIADIMDVNESGQSQKPFGRVFYTKTKSLVFYAYDLDRQPGVKRTSTFQVWGRAGASDKKSINLGMLYMDSATNRRWTLRVDNPDQLARLDAVFVTIEPRAQAENPTGKPFLYASLRREPNHP
jgi:hypothetical protein